MDAGMIEDLIVKVEGQRGKRSEVLEELGIGRSTYYKWRKAYRERGVWGLAKAKASRFRIWNRLPPSEVERILEIARLHPERTPSNQSEDSVLVVGAGPAGLEAARVLGTRSYQVTLAEAKRDLGGRVFTESRLPGLSEWIRVLDYRHQQIVRMSNVSVYRESKLTAEDILEFDYPRVVIATGSRWRRDGVGRWHVRPIPGFEGTGVFTPEDVMSGVELSGPTVVFDDEHYYMGVVIAEKLRNDDLEVSLVTSASVAAAWSRHTYEQERTQARLLNMGVEILPGRVVASYDFFSTVGGRNCPGL